MADLTPSDVKVLAQYNYGSGLNYFGGSPVVAPVQVKLCEIGGTVGSASNKALASAFGFSKLLNVSAVTSNAKIYPTSIAADGTYFYIADAASTTAANHINPADLNMSSNKGTLSVLGIV